MKNKVFIGLMGALVITVFARTQFSDTSQVENSVSSESEEDGWATGLMLPPMLAELPTDGPTYDVKAKGYEYDRDNLTYELVFEDNFDGNELNLDNWDFDIGGSGWGNAELQYYTAGDNVEVVDGNMIIEARIEDKEGMKYTSSRLVTRGKQDFTYGKFEIRAILPEGLGTWPAIWMLPTDWVYGGWPESGEIDILEHVGQYQDLLLGTIHTEGYNHMNGTEKQGTIVKENVSNEFNVYTLEWLPDALYVGVNDEIYFEYRPLDYKENPSYKEWPFDVDMHLLLNIAIGGNLGGPVDDSIFPQQMVVDYVKVYQSPEINALVND